MNGFLLLPLNPLLFQLAEVVVVSAHQHSPTWEGLQLCEGSLGGGGQGGRGRQVDETLVTHDTPPSFRIALPPHPVNGTGVCMVLQLWLTHMKEGFNVECVFGYFLEELEEGDGVCEAQQESLVEPQYPQAHTEEDFAPFKQETVHDAQDGLGEGDDDVMVNFQYSSGNEMQ